MTQFQDNLRKRALMHGRMFIKRDSTIRTVAKESGVSIQTVHNDLYKLKEIHPALFEKVKEKLTFNVNTRHIKAGEATKKMWERKQK